MKIRVKYTVGDLLNCEETVLAHGCNARGVMGAGVALAIATRWPGVKLAMDHGLASGALYMGSVVWADPQHADGKRVANVLTQERVGRDPNVRYASYDGIARGLETVAREALERGWLRAGESIAVPQIGAGLGNASWRVVEQIMFVIAEKHDITFNVYTLQPIEEL